MGRVSPLGRYYRFRPGIGLEARYADEPDVDFKWRVSSVPSLVEAIEVPGEVEAMIAARDAAVTDASA